MRMYKRFIGSVGLAVALFCSSVAFASDFAGSLFVGYLVDTTPAYSMAKLKAELSYVANAPSVLDGGAGSGLVRESHGFRQATADEYDNLGTPVLT